MSDGTRHYPRFSESPDGSTIRGYSEGDMELLCEAWSDLHSYCDSPIEIELANELFHRFTLEQQYWPYIIRPTADSYPKMGYSIQPQMRVGLYRADFAITLMEQEQGHGGWGVYTLSDLPHTFHAQLVVECDGHDFHEKTKEQAARDKRRDRVFLQNGWPVARFTGSEIKADAGRCADQVIAILRAMIDAEARATELLRSAAREKRLAEGKAWGLT